MSDVLADTHAIVWFLFDPPRLASVADATLTMVSRSSKIFISAITLVEISYLSAKKSFPDSGIFPQLISLAKDLSGKGSQ